MVPNRLVIVGQGYVGPPVAMRAVDTGYDVVGVDVDNRRIARLRAGESNLEDVSDQTVALAVASRRYLPSTDHADAQDFQYAVITVPTPLRHGVPDLTFDDVRSSWTRATA
ncbi:hypothetical protein [Micromonospora sp. NPDC049679]|uniref:hypothetical protein n=1 Tax=Micromonospora sp. NPDC049679 TaxID=3155920 RepID=UPI0033D19ED5